MTSTIPAHGLPNLHFVHLYSSGLLENSFSGHCAQTVTSVSLRASAIVALLWRLEARHLGPKKYRMKGMGIATTARKPKRLYVHAPVRFMIILMMTSGRKPAIRIRKQAADVSAERVPRVGYASKR